MILEQYLSIMDLIDHDELVNSLEIIVKNFSDQISPYAKKLTEQLVSKYKDMIQNAEEQEMLGESFLSSTSCVSTIKRIFMAIAEDA